MAPLPSTRTELHMSDQYANKREQSLLIWLNNEMEVGQSILLKSCVTYFWDIPPIHVARVQKYSYSNEAFDRKWGPIRPSTSVFGVAMESCHTDLHCHSFALTFFFLEK